MTRALSARRSGSNGGYRGTRVGTPGYRAGDAARARIDARMAALSARMEELADVSVVQSGWTTEGTGELVGGCGRR